MAKKRLHQPIDVDRKISLNPVGSYSEHKSRWAEGCGSQHCQGSNKVFARGTIPCDLLFCGEASGESENCLKKPFVGPAGKLLDIIIGRSVPDKYTYAMTNLVCCIPREDGGSKVEEPDDDTILSCKPRLEEFITLCKPKIIVCVGKLPEKWFDTEYKRCVKTPENTLITAITHPAAILRANIAQRGLAVQRCIVTIKTVIRGFESNQE